MKINNNYKTDEGDGLNYINKNKIINKLSGKGGVVQKSEINIGKSRPENLLKRSYKVINKIKKRMKKKGIENDL